MPRDNGHYAGLSRGAVLSTARDIASDEGLDKLTIRSLAARLDVAPNAVYGWVDSKAALLDALVDDALSHVADFRPAGTPDRDPTDALVALLLDAFDAIQRQPALAPLFLDRAASPGPNATRIRTLVHELLTAQGIDKANAAAAVPILLVHVIGFGAFVQQTHGAALLDEPHLGPPRDLVARSLSWLIAGALGTEPQQSSWTR